MTGRAMEKLSFVAVCLRLFQPCVALYTLIDNYGGDSFLDKFDFFTDQDPTHGFVTYVDQTTAVQSGLVGLRNDSVYLGVDYSHATPVTGRSSVRLTSKNTYNMGLVVLDLLHMPGSICGVWPAFWTSGSDWPKDGEIDIIEGVNLQTSNRMALHTQSSCLIESQGSFTGTLLGTQCATDTNNVGCGIDALNNETYGDAFNNISGGVYVVEWTEQAIKIWFFPRSSIPNDIMDGVPNPGGWTMPLATFSGACPFNSSFVDQQIIFDTTFCGDWAGTVWTADPVCSLKAPSCEEFVGTNPREFVEAYWLISSLKVYQWSWGTEGVTTLSTTSVTSTTGPTPTTGDTSVSELRENQTTTPVAHFRPSWSPLPFSFALPTASR